MRKEILNIINQILSYNASQGTTDSPLMRSFDWTRRMTGLSVGNPQSDNFVLSPGQTVSVFNGSKPNPLDTSSVLDLLSVGNGLYRLNVTAGSSEFRTRRSISGISNCSISINNLSMAVFNFSGSTLSSVQIGDTMRIKGSSTHDSGPFAFNSLNSGNWLIIGKNGTSLSCVRPVGETFTAAAESISDASGDIDIYSSSGLQKGDKMQISGAFSLASFRSYELKEVTPDYLDFISTVALPIETDISYIDNAINFYTSAKKYIYMESDQVCVVQFNGSSDITNKIVPVAAGSPTLPGFLSQTGDFYSCDVTNKSLNVLNLKIFSGE